MVLLLSSTLHTQSYTPLQENDLTIGVLLIDVPMKADDATIVPAN